LRALCVVNLPVIFRHSSGLTMAYVRRWYGVGLDDPTPMTTETAGAGDTPFDAVDGSPVYTDESIDFPLSSGAEVCNWTGLDLATMALRIYFAFGATTAAVPIASLFDTGGARVARFDSTNSGQFVARNAANSGVAYSGAYTPGAVYVLDLTYVAETGVIDIVLLDSTLGPFWTRTYDTGTTNSFGQLRLGRDSGTAGGPIDIARVLLAGTATHIGPDAIIPAFALTGPSVHPFATSASQRAFTVDGPSRS